MKKISRRNFLLASGAVTLSAALSACGGSSSGTASPAAASTASSAAANAPAAQGKVLNIWCWNDEFQSRFNDYYPEVASIADDKSTTTLKAPPSSGLSTPTRTTTTRTSWTRPC